MTIGVMDFDGLSGVSQEKADVLADILAEEISRLGNIRVITKSDIQSMLNLEKQKRLAGCTDTECFSEVAGALGMPWMVTGNVSRLGNSYILNLKLMDVRKAIVVRRTTHRIRGSEDDLLDELPEATEELFEIVTEQWGLATEKRVTIAARHSQPVSRTPSAVTAITRSQIENTHCTDVICLLRQVPEVDVRRILPAFAVVGARALTDTFGNRAIVFVDGREVIYELFGYVPWQALPVHLDDIERIEVIRGPGSALYGANAHSTVVSITTRKALRSGAETLLASGEHGRTSIHLRLHHVFNDWYLHISGGLETADNWRIPDQREREIHRLCLHLKHGGESSTSQLRVGVESPNALIFTMLGPVRSRDTYIGNLSLSHQTELLRMQLSLQVLDAVYHSNTPFYWRETKMGDFPTLFDVLSTTMDAEVQATWSPLPGNLLISGGNYRWFYFFSDDNDPSETHQHRVGIFIHDEQRLFEDLVITAGVRFDYNNITPYAISPRLAGVWQLSEDHSIRLAFGQAFRKPSFYETSTHLKGATASEAFPEFSEFFKNNIGNSNLGNEKTTTLEAGYRAYFLGKSLTFETDVFYTQFRNTISFQLDIQKDNFGLPDLNNSEMKFQNTGREVDSFGGSVSLTYHMKNDWRFNANYTFRHSWHISDPLGGPVPTEGSGGERVSWEPAHLANFSCQYVTEHGLRMGASLHVHSESDLAWPEDGGILGENIVIHSPTVYFIGAFMAWQIDINPGWAELGVRVFNILNSGVRDLPAVVRPDGVELGGELLGRRILLFMRARI